MENTYCGKDCDDCLSREEVGCPGCKLGPGKGPDRICEISRCCSRKFKEMCATCESNTSCAVLAERESMMQKWNGNRTREAVERAEAISTMGTTGSVYSESRATGVRDGHDATFVRNSLLAIFWLMLVAWAGNILSNESIFGSVPVVMGLGSIISIGAAIAQAVLMIRLGQEEGTYKVAGICALVATGLSFVAELCTAFSASVMNFSDMLAGGIGLIFALVLLVAALVLDVISGYKFLVANGKIVERRDFLLAKRWDVMSKLFLWILGGIVIIAVLILAMPLIGVILAFLFVLGVFAFGICQYVFLYQTANRFRV